MPFAIDEKLVVAIASSALFDLGKSHTVFEEKGEKEYREYQRTHEAEKLTAGVAFPFIRRLLSVNRPDSGYEPVEVVLFSRNDPDTGLRVMNSIEAFGLSISRGAFVSGRDPFRYLEAFNASIFLSADEQNVRDAVMRGLPAGRVLASEYVDEQDDAELRIAFDFDGVLVDDEAEAIFQMEGLDAFQKSERLNALKPMNPGPLKRFLMEIGKLQREELERHTQDSKYVPKIRTAIITSRNAPAHKRVVTTLRDWGIQVDETFFLGGMDKRRVLEIFKPHLFFDDQMTHAGPAAGMVPSVHVPFGRLLNSTPEGGSSSSVKPSDSRDEDRKK